MQAQGIISGIFLGVCFAVFGMIFLGVYLDNVSDKKRVRFAEEAKSKYYLKITLADGTILQTHEYEPEMFYGLGGYYIISSEDKARSAANYIINNGCNMNNVFYPVSEIRKVEVLS